MFKLSILGGSLDSVAGYTHFVASRMDKRFDIVSGVFSRNYQINKKTAEYWKINRFYNSLEEFLKYEKGKVDAVSVLLPTPYHFEVVKKLLENDIPVICEKPLFSSLNEFKVLEEKIDLSKKFLVITYNYIAYPILFELRKMILKGDLGDIINIHLEMPQESFLKPPKSINYPPEWRKKDGVIPGILLDLASHLLSLSKYLTEKNINSVYSTFRSYSTYKVVDEVKVILDYEDDITGFLWVSKVAIGNRNGLKISIYGTKASAIWIQEDPEKIYINFKNGEKRILDRGANIEISKIKIYNRMTSGHPAGFIEAFANLYYEIANALENYTKGKNYKENPLIWTFEKEKESFQVLEAIVQSANENKKIKVEKWKN